MDYRHNSHEMNWPRSERINPLESKLNMYERQIDQLFDFAYKDQDDIKTLFNIMNDLKELHKSIGETSVQIKEINELKTCIQNYYQLELDNKRRMLNHECYQFQLFIIQLFIISYLIYLAFI